MLAICVVVSCSALALFLACLCYLEGEKKLAFMLRNSAVGAVFVYMFIVLILSFDKVGW